jgi:polar amino acid transport system substrate-binding protein
MFIRILYLILGFLLLSTQSEASSKLVIAGDYWCPYNCKPNDRDQGYLVELIKTVFSNHEIDVEYISMPWIEALKAAREGRIDAVVGSSLKESEGLITTNSPIITTQINAYTSLYNKNWILDGVNSLGNKKICVIVGYSSSGVIQKHILDNCYTKPHLFEYVNTNFASVDCFQKIIDMDVDVVIESENVIKSISNSLSMHKGLVFAGIVNEEGLYIAFSPQRANSKKHLEILQRALDSEKFKDKFKKIALKYGL